MSFFEAIRPIVDSLQIPVQLATGFVSLRVTLYFLEPKGRWWQMGLLYALHWGIRNAVVYIADPWPPFLMSLFFIGGLCLLCKGRLLARVSMGVILLLPSLTLNALLTEVRPPFDHLLFLNILLLWSGILLFVHKALPRGARPPIRSTRMWAMIDLLALMPFGAALSILAMTEMEGMGVHPDPFYDKIFVRNATALMVILGLAAIAALSLLVAVVVMARHEHLESEEVLWSLRSQYYHNLEQSQQQVRRLRHDMANHLTALAGLEDGARSAYLEELIHSPAMTAGRRYAENGIVNAVLSAKEPVMEEAGIDHSLDISVPESLPVSEVDLCALFANSLDNAIEANLRLPREERKLRLSAAVGKGFFVLRLVNRTDGALSMADGRIVTRKRDKELHGFGLAGMEEIAARYGGSMKAEQAGGEFRLVVSLPVTG